MKVWIYVDGRQQGPFDFEQLAGMPGVTPSTKVWFEGLPKWYPAGSLDQMRPLFDGSMTPAGMGAETSELSENSEISECSECSEISEISQPSERPEPPAEAFRQPFQPAPRQPQQPFRPAPQQLAAAMRPPCPPTYLAWSVILVVCCCSPVSMAALAASIMVSTYYSKQNYERAAKASEWAAWLVMISLALGMVPCMLMSMLYA